MNLFIKHKNYSTPSIISMAYFCMIFAALAHIIYSIVYFKTGYTFLGIHSICAIIMYCILIINFSEKRIRPIFIIINLELLSFVIFNISIFFHNHIHPFVFLTNVSYVNFAPSLKPATKLSALLVVENSI